MQLNAIRRTGRQALPRWKFGDRAEVERDSCTDGMFGWAGSLDWCLGQNQGLLMEIVPTVDRTGADFPRGDFALQVQEAVLGKAYLSGPLGLVLILTSQVFSSSKLPSKRLNGLNGGEKIVQSHCALLSAGRRHRGPEGKAWGSMWIWGWWCFKGGEAGDLPPIRRGHGTRLSHQQIRSGPTHIQPTTYLI